MAEGFSVRVYIVQRVAPDGRPDAILAVKLTMAAAQAVAKAKSPCVILSAYADKEVSSDSNVGKTAFQK
jgi:hypothetical protein